MDEFSGTSNIKSLFGKNVKRFRNNINYSQSDLAEKVGLSINMISEIENEKKFVSDDTIAKFADFFKVEPYRLFLPEGKWFIPEEEIYESDFLDTMASAVREHLNNYLKIVKNADKEH